MQYFDHVRVDGVSQSYGGRAVLSEVSLTVAHEERLGLIGENGAGKSTLLRIMAGVERPDSGVVARPPRTGFLWQEVQSRHDSTLGDLIESSIGELRGIERELVDAAAALGEDTAAESRYARALEAAERAEVWSIDARRDELLFGLGVGDIPLSRQLSEVSGGQRSRFALAALLLTRPDALLLDEPTNHLDDSAAAFLRGQLIHWNGPVVFASHDRAFLDEVATSLVDLDPSASGPTRFGAGPLGGPYTEYLGAKSAERARWEARFAEEQAELARLRQAVDVTARHVAHGRAPRDNDKFIAAFKRGRNDAAIARRVHNAEGRLETLERKQVRKPRAALSFAGIPRGSQVLEGEGALLQLTDARVEGRLSVASVRVGSSSQLLVTGRNGAGKSALLGVLAGRQSLDSGSLLRRRGLRVGLLEQDVRWRDPGAASRSIYAAVLGESRAEQVPLVSLGLVAPRDLDRPVGELSIGQQRRVALALIIAKPPHVFLLDEPTNHLSLGLATQLEEALSSYPGAVVVASHDRWLRRGWQGEVLALD